MISSRLIMLSFWIMCLFANTSAQKVTSTLPASNRTCAGTRITFNCSITGSSTVTNLIVAWRSPEYIGEGTSLQFTTDDVMGESKMSMINDDVTAQLVYKGDRSGTPTLESQLQLTASTNFTNPTISCRSSLSGSITRITFYVLNTGIPGIPHNAKGTEFQTYGVRCVLFLTWDAPLDYDEVDIDHYIVEGPSTNIRTKEKSTIYSVGIAPCKPDLNANVSAVDLCGREGPSTVIVVHLDVSELNETVPTQQVATPQENQSGPDEVAVIAIVIAVIAIILTMLFAILLVILFCYFRKRLKDYPHLRDRGDIALQTVPTNLSKRLLTLCKDSCTAEVGDFISLLNQGADPNIYDERGRHPLWYAIYHGKRDLVELFLQYKADVNFKAEDGRTALHHASKSGLTDVVKLLVDSDAQIDNIDEDGQTALHHASNSGHKDVVKLLVDSGAQIDNKDKHGRTALYLASNSGHTDVVKLLVVSRDQIDYKSEYGRTALHRASIGGYTDVVKLLVDCHAQIDIKDKNGRTALHHASISGHTDVVKLLVDSGAQIDNKDKYSRTALHLASISGHTGVVKLLVDFGAQIDNKDKDNLTALYRASYSGHTDVVKLLTDSGAQIDNKDNDGFTPLYVASKNGRKEVVELLLDKGANVDHQDKDGGTPLYVASQKGHKGVVELLLNKGANVNQQTKYGWTALRIASCIGHTDVVKLLVDSGAQIDNKDKDGWAALHLASNSGHTDVVKLLVDSGAKIDNKDNYGWTAHDLASSSGYTDVVKLLVDSGAQIDNKKVVKSGQITDPDRLFNDLSLHIHVKFMEIGIELGLQYGVLIDELEAGEFMMLPGNRKALKMLHLWQQSVAEDNFTYSVLATALKKHGFLICARKYCYSSIATQE